MKHKPQLHPAAVREAEQIFADIYAFVFALFLSNALMGSPMIGGTFYLCGSIGASLLASEPLRPLLTRRHVVLNNCLYGVLLLLNLLLIFYYPYEARPFDVWTIFAVQLTVFGSDYVLNLTARRLQSGKRIRLPLAAVLNGVLALFGAGFLYVNAHRDVLLVCAYLVMYVLHAYAHFRAMHSAESPCGEPLSEKLNHYRRGYAYRLFETASLFVNMAACLSVVLVYSSLSLTSQQFVLAMSIALLCMVLSVYSAQRYLHRRQHRRQLEAGTLVLWGLALWMAGLLLYCTHAMAPGKDVWKRFAGMALCSYGISLSLHCLNEVSRVLQLSTQLYVRESTQAYEAANTSRKNTVMLISELAALLFLTFSLTVYRKSYLENIEFAGHLQPFLLIPAGILIIAAFATLLKFPVTDRYAQKLTRLLGLEAAGVNNKALHDQVESIFVKERKRPLGTNLIKAALRPFLRHTLIGRERLREDETNPLVLLCNHSEIYGPLASVLNLPLSVRPWVISDLVVDPEEFAVFFNRYTLSKIHWLSETQKLRIARTLGKISVWGMNQLDSIPVYRNKPAKLTATMRLTVAAMEAGDNILIFPENPDADAENPGYATEGVGELFSGFALLSLAYYRKTKKCCRFLPIFVGKESRSIQIGTEIVYNPQNEIQAECDRISAEAGRQMQAMYLRQKSGRRKAE